MNVKRYKKRGIKKYVKKTKRTSSKNVVPLTKAVRKAVKQVIYQQAETKHTPVNEVEYAFPNNNNLLQPSVNLSNTFTIDQGTGDGQRIGNKIKITKATLNYIVRRNNTTSSQYPCELHIWIGYMKQSRNENPDPYHPYIYQDGPSVLPWNGSQLRTLRQTNKDIFVIFKKLVIKCGGAKSTSPQYDNNDYKVLTKGRLSLKPMLGTLTYGDDGGASNFDKDLWMWASYCYIDDTIDSLSSNPALKPVDFLYWVDTEYKDF